MSDLDDLRALTREQALAFYEEAVASGGLDAARWLARNDRFFLLGCVLGRPDVLEREWCYRRCREVEADPDGRLDLWSRFHYKSTIITFAGSIQEILRNPDVTIGILSYNKPIAHKFVDQVRRALESPALTRLFPDVLWERPPRQNWSTQGGIIVKRRSNPKEPTLSGSGLVDGQPIGAHYALRIYDDVVVPSSVSTPEQIRKTTSAWELSLALGTDDGGRAWYAGTRYHVNDTYSEILKRGSLKERRRVCVAEDGSPLMMDRAALERLRADMGAYTWGAQMMQNPVGAGVCAFRREWLAFYDAPPARDTMNVYVFVDGANAKKRSSDFTTMWVVGYGQDGNRYVLDCEHDRMNLSERTDRLFAIQRAWRPNITFWEQVGAMSDVQHVQIEQDRRGWHFPVVPLPHSTPKDQRIRSLQPEFEQGRMWLPRKLRKVRVDGTAYDPVEEFVEDEYLTYPIVTHDDMLDPLADVNDPQVRAAASFPRPRAEGVAEDGRANTSWSMF